VPGCLIANEGKILTFCKTATNVTYYFFDAARKILGAINSVGLNNSSSATMTRIDFPTATGINFSATFSDRSKVLNATIPVNGSATVAFAPPPRMTLSLKWPTIGASYLFQSYTYEWWDDTKALTEPKRVNVGSTFYELSFAGLTPPEGATRLILAFRFTNGASMKGVTIPFPPSTVWSWPSYEVIDSPY